VGNRTIEALTNLGFDHKQALGVSRGDVLVIPICPPDGSSSAVMIRPDIPRALDKKGKKLPDGTFAQQVRLAVRWFLAAQDVVTRNGTGIGEVQK
jgi:hypothetical protein